MSMLLILAPLSLVLVLVAVWAFFWAVNSGQLDDLETPAWNVLVDEESFAAHSSPDNATKQEPATQESINRESSCPEE